MCNTMLNDAGLDLQQTLVSKTMAIDIASETQSYTYGIW
jgi:hypothetical protein